MNNTVYLAENNAEFEIVEIQEPEEYNTETEQLPPLPEEAMNSSELAFVANKSLVSFGTMAICIIIILICAFILKNKKQNKDASAHEIFADDEMDASNNKSSDLRKKSQKTIVSSSIHNSILSFLEKTKDI